MSSVQIAQNKDRIEIVGKANVSRNANGTQTETVVCQLWKYDDFGSTKWQVAQSSSLPTKIEEAFEFSRVVARCFAMLQQYENGDVQLGDTVFLGTKVLVP